LDFDLGLRLWVSGPGERGGEGGGRGAGLDK